MTQSAAVIRTEEQLAQSVRFGSMLRIPRLELVLQAGASFCSVNDLKQALSREMERYSEHLQLYNWGVKAGLGLFGLTCQLQASYYDGSEDRLFVRRRVYSRALALCSGGKPELRRVCMAVRQDMAYGNGANPHCVSSSLREGCGVCQAIALYLCQLLLRCGYPCVVRTGTVNGVGHAWNMVLTSGAWRRLDLCVTGPAAEYIDTTHGTPQEQYAAMTSCLSRRVKLYERGAEVAGIRPPVFIADRRWVCPTRFVQCFNGAYLTQGDEIILCMGAEIRRVPLRSLRETAQHVPYMEVGQFASLFGLRYENDCMLFTEGL